MDAIRIARAFTGRDTIVKIFGSYHGHHDYVMVSISVPYENIGDPDNYASLPYGAGIPKAASDLTIAVPFNDADAMERRIERLFEEGRPPACVIMEPAMMNLGVVLPEPGYLESVRDITRRHGVVLIFDEVKTGVVLAWGGAYEHFGVQPDLFCLAKSIGGGIPIGAFGGRAEVMRVIETLEGSQHFAGMGGAVGTGIEKTTIPGGATRVAHLGTFNGNPLSMTAGLVTLTQILTRDAYPRLHAMADRLTAGSQAVIDRTGLPGYAINVGPKGCVMFTPERVTNYRDFIGLDSELWAASFFYLANRGILLPPGPDDQWTLSVQHSDADIDRYVEVFGEFAAEVTA